MSINNEKSEIIKNQILNFINDKDKHETNINNKYLLMKHSYKDNVFLYSKNIYYDAMETLKARYEYQGFYNLISNKFYDLGYQLSELIDLRGTLSCNRLKSKILDGIRGKIAEELKVNHQKYFKEPIKLEDEELSNQLKYWEEYHARDSAKRDFFVNEIKSLIDFICLRFSSSEIKEISIDEILSFIQGPETLLNYYKDEFLNKCIGGLYVDFKRYVIYKKYISEIENNKSNILHKQKFLKDAIKDKKTVNVTILKDGHQFTFKTDSKDFFRLDNRYSRYNIQAKDRRKYEELFKCSDYLFEEIISIKYGKQEIYRK